MLSIEDVLNEPNHRKAKKLARQLEEQNKVRALDMVGNAIKMAGTALVSGVVDGDVYESRIAICGQCPHYINSRCELCGCFMQAKARINAPKEQLCPKDKWLE